MATQKPKKQPVPPGPRAPDPDLPLVLRAQAGDEGAFKELYKKYYGVLMFRAGRWFRGDYTRQRDAVNDVFSVVWESLPKFRKNAKFSTWLWRVAFYVMRHIKYYGSSIPLKKKAVDWANLDLSAYSATSIPSEEENAAVIQDRLDILRDIWKLPVEQARVLTLRYYLDLSTTDVAYILDCHEETVRRHHRAGKVALRKKMRE